MNDEKIYDERRAAYRSQIAVNDDSEGFISNLLVSYAGREMPDLMREVNAWAEAEAFVEMCHRTDETIGLPQPPLFLETWLSPKIFEVKAQSNVASISNLTPRFSKMNRVSLIEWLDAKADTIAHYELWSLLDEIKLAHAADSRAKLTDLCQRVWEEL